MPGARGVAVTNCNTGSLDVSNSVEGTLASGTSRRNPSCVSEHRRYKVVGKQTWANQRHSLIDDHVVFQLFQTWEGLGVSLVCHLTAITRFHLPLGGILPSVRLAYAVCVT